MKNPAYGSRKISSWVGALAALGLFLLFFPHADAPAAEAKRNVKFDHVKTGFPLTGAHVTLPCETCHVQGTFKGTPRKCETCHTPGSRVQSATVKPSNHIPTIQACGQCHSSTASWKVARFTHVGVMPRQCGQCHNNSIVEGKPAKHPATNQPCDACHRTTTWMSAGFTHMDAKPGACATCHNGAQATGKPGNHIPTTLSCDTCHTTGGSFATSRFNHSTTQGVAPGKCNTCHNGSFTQWNALGKTANHIVTTASCDTCHSGFQSFATVSSTFNHSGVTPGACATCHNGSQASGKPSNHIPTTLSCDACHGTGTTFTTSTFNHSANQGVAPGGCNNCHNGSYAQWNALGKPANHVVTTAACDTCHKNYVSFAGATFNHAGVTPGGCASCHNGSQASGKPANHIPTTLSCDACHGTGTTFATSTFTHSATQGVVPGGCNNCHNGSYAQWNALGKPANHVVTTAACDSCHTGYVSFAGAGFNHAGVTPGGCASCHNGSQATGKPSNHIPTTLSCDACHSTGGTFTTSTFTHSATQGVVPGGCNNCHNGAYTQWNALGKPANHVVTTAACDSCHTGYATFAGAGFNHAGVAPGSCASCHNGTQAVGKPAGHMVTARACDSCHHSTAAGGFQLPVSYSHTSAYFTTHSSGVNANCLGCHKANTETIAGVSAYEPPNCYACHAGDFKPGSHKKTEVPTTILYTAVELRNCAGSCHQYTNNTFTTILKSRTGEHRATSGGF
jgi:hypothetical protein